MHFGRAGGGREQPPLDVGIEHGLAGRGGPQRPPDLGPRRVLGQIAERATMTP